MNSNQLVFPSTATVKQLIEDLNGIKWEAFQGGDVKIYLDRIEEKFFRRLQFTSTFVKITPEYSSVPIKFYRVRPLSEIVNDKLYCEYSYPTPRYTTKNGRANLINHPVFYASDHPVGAVLEYIQTIENVQSYKDREFAISTWVIRSPGQYFFAPFFSSNLTSHNMTTELAEFTRKQVEELGNKITDDQYNAVKLLNNYVADLFLNDDHRGISSYLAHKIIYDNPIGHCFIMYAAKRAGYHTNNYAFHPNFVDSQMELRHVYKVKISDITRDDTGFQIKFEMPGTFAVSSRGVINWVEIENNLDIFRSAYCDDFEMSGNLS